MGGNEAHAKLTVENDNDLSPVLPLAGTLAISIDEYFGYSTGGWN